MSSEQLILFYMTKKTYISVLVEMQRVIKIVCSKVNNLSLHKQFAIQLFNCLCFKCVLINMRVMSMFSADNSWCRQSFIVLLQVISTGPMWLLEPSKYARQMAVRGCWFTKLMRVSITSCCLLPCTHLKGRPCLHALCAILNSCLSSHFSTSIAMESDRYVCMVELTITCFFEFDF